MRELTESIQDDIEESECCIGGWMFDDCETFTGDSSFGSSIGGTCYSSGVSKGCAFCSDDFYG